ncbi:SMC-Scp complex subunit ScpB [Micromonospora sp. D93]|uniref:SMC-Scp complex subunit ScpB n=1 Tax=Micromonospora sp. D93 TaxID=2824886 RepID=UPI001B383C67|nr:SMC-Scp complex subunit ScpB [Micromonospora sp. D93]MBQ1019886.1 SMC-Scp complex subunit ScpB [Micromonospora sp. D93]
MSDEERRDSLADQAAAWVPPWDRPRPPAAEDTPENTDVPRAESTPSTVSAIAPPSDQEDLGGEVPIQGPEPSKISAEPDANASGSESESGTGTGSTVGEPGHVGEPDATAGDVPRRQLAGRRRATVAPEPAPELSDAELRGALEAILLVVDEPVSELVLAQVLEQPAERVGPMLDEIAAGYTAAGHGFELRRAAGGWRLYTRPEYATYVERFVLDGQSVRLTQAALETLAVVAYKQPVTRSRISAIRGVNCDGVIRTLVTRGLIEECGTETDSGAFLYRTTTLFLEKLGLNTVDELPPLAPFLPDDVEELADATR